jgi:hypothetical protein
MMPVKEAFNSGGIPKIEPLFFTIQFLKELKKKKLKYAHK